MIRIVDKASRLDPMVAPTLFVDDLAADATAPVKHVMQQLGGFIETIADFVNGTGQELSETKSLVTASIKKIGEALCERWEKHGVLIQFRTRVKALGVGLGAGVRRNAAVAKGRLQGYSARIRRFRRLRKVGVDTARLLRTGLKAMTYGSSIMGVACGMLRAMRQVAAAIAAPGAGTCGQNMDIALMIADGSSGGRADPAFDAHMMPIGEWALACWEGWTTDGAMDVMIKDAKTRLKGARNQWAKVCGPAAAMIMTCMRIGWEVMTARQLVTHTGEVLNLKMDPPAVVLQRVVEAVKRWRWIRIEKVCPQLAANGSGRGALMEPEWQLLNTKAKNDGWNEKHKAGLRSAAAGRHIPQARVKMCGWAKPDRCLTC